MRQMQNLLYEQFEHLPAEKLVPVGGGLVMNRHNLPLDPTAIPLLMDASFSVAVKRSPTV